MRVGVRVGFSSISSYPELALFHNSLQDHYLSRYNFKNPHSSLQSSFSSPQEPARTLSHIHCTLRAAGPGASASEPPVRPHAHLPSLPSTPHLPTIHLPPLAPPPRDRIHRTVPLTTPRPRPRNHQTPPVTMPILSTPSSHCTFAAPINHDHPAPPPRDRQGPRTGGFAEGERPPMHPSGCIHRRRTNPALRRPGT